MRRFMVKTGKSPAGRAGYALELAPNNNERSAPIHDPAKQPVSRQDILNLQEALVWPPVEMRDVNLTEMENQRHSLNSVWEDPNLDPTSKLLRASLHSQLFAVANKKYFSRGEPGANNLPTHYNSTPPLTPAQEHQQQTATIQDQKQTHNLIPKVKGRALSVDKAILHAPSHQKHAARAMVVSLLDPQSSVKWDAGGKIINMKVGVKGQGLVVRDSNLQDIIGYATSPSPHDKAHKAYALVRDALITQGKDSLINTASEKLFKMESMKKKRKALSLLTPPTTLVPKNAKKKPRIVGETPIGRKTTKVTGSKLHF